MLLTRIKAGKTGSVRSQGNGWHQKAIGQQLALRGGLLRLGEQPGGQRELGPQDHRKQTPNSSFSFRRLVEANGLRRVFRDFLGFWEPGAEHGAGGNLVFTSGQRKPKWPVECAWDKGRDELPAGPRRRVLLRVILENEIWGLRTPPASDRIFAFARVDPTQTPPCRVERLIFELK